MTAGNTTGASVTGSARASGYGNAGAGIFEVPVISNTKIAGDIYRLTLQSGDAGGMQAAFSAANPGQFINLYLHDRSMLLPRPLSICFTEKERITLVYRVVGKGTKELSMYKEGDTLKISTPLGQGYDISAVFRALDGMNPDQAGTDKDGADKDGANKTRSDEAGTDKIGADKTGADRAEADLRTVALVAGGLGAPPMVGLAKAIRERLGRWDQNRCDKNCSGKNRADSGMGRTDSGENQADSGTDRTDSNRNNKIRLISVLGFQEVPILEEELKELCDEVYISTENGSAGFHGNVIEMMEALGIRADYYLSCGPRPMLKALAGFCGRERKPLQVSLEERMGCGYGACVGCVCRIRETDGGTAKIKQKKVCKDGPVFFGDEVIWDD